MDAGRADHLSGGAESGPGMRNFRLRNPAIGEEIAYVLINITIF